MDKKLDGKTIIITGANTGIGYEAALELAKRNARIILACRDPKRGQDAVDRIKAESKNDNVELELLNLASLKSIKEFSERILKKIDKLDILINNAGLAGIESRTLTEDGFETIFGVNHLGHFYLTNLLLDLLEKSVPSRIINVSSMAHYYGKINFDDLQSEKKYSEMGQYSMSKLANVLFTTELARRYKDKQVTSVCLHPGLIKSEIWRNREAQTGFIAKSILFFVRLFGKDCKEGAKSIIYCATNEDIPSKNGLYFNDDTRLKEASRDGTNLELAAKLWDLSAKLVGL